MVDDLKCVACTLNRQVIIRETDHIEVSGINYIFWGKKKEIKNKKAMREKRKSQTRIQCDKTLFK